VAKVNVADHFYEGMGRGGQEPNKNYTERGKRLLG